jgi:hypothetical protein
LRGGKEVAVKILHHSLPYVNTDGMIAHVLSVTGALFAETSTVFASLPGDIDPLNRVRHDHHFRRLQFVGSRVDRGRSWIGATGEGYSSKSEPNSYFAQTDAVFGLGGLSARDIRALGFEG